MLKIRVSGFIIHKENWIYVMLVQNIFNSQFRFLAISCSCNLKGMIMKLTHLNVLFLYLMKTSESLWRISDVIFFSRGFRGYRIWAFAWRIKRQCCPHVMGTSQLICAANKLTVFYMRATLAFNQLKRINWTFLLSFFQNDAGR